MIGKRSILVIDDDAILLSLIDHIFSKAGWQVYTAVDGVKGLKQLQLHQPDLIILDIMMPGMNGWETCSHIRQCSQVPIIMLTALDHESHIIRGLRESGADDYLIKPFNANILVAQAEALLRRAALPAMTKQPTTYSDAYLTIDLTTRQVLVGGETVKLTMTEYRLLAYLLQHTNRVLSFNHILGNIWGPEYQNSLDYVHVYVSRLRQKLEQDPKDPQYLQTVHGVGYRFKKPARPAEAPSVRASSRLARSWG
jgi:DNA-binding response OmpR family regulator